MVPIHNNIIYSTSSFHLWFYIGFWLVLRSHITLIFCIEFTSGATPREPLTWHLIFRTIYKHFDNLQANLIAGYVYRDPKDLLLLKGDSFSLCCCPHICNSCCSWLFSDWCWHWANSDIAGIAQVEASIVVPPVVVWEQGRAQNVYREAETFHIPPF